jgi:RimJ/RimL family protein N-acetyltransferase
VWYEQAAPPTDAQNIVIETDRLLLRPFCDADRGANAEIFADPLVRRFALSALTRPAADARLDQAMTQLRETGIGMLAVEDKRDGSMIGMLGLTGFGPALKALIPSHPELQIAWQLASRVWGQGLATEAAIAMLGYAWQKLRAREVVAMTAAVNAPSRRVMEKAGMVHEPMDDFLHPDFPVGHVLRAHVLYRISAR